MTRHFAFVHIPKTGGSFVRRVLAEQLPADWFLEVPAARHQHQGWDELPMSAAALPVLSFVRNPWDWYVSWYHYHLQLSADLARGAFYRTAFANGANSFAQAVHNACEGGFEHPDPRIRATMHEHGVDFYTARVLNILGAGLQDERLTVGRQERLVKDLDDFLLDNEVPVPAGFRELLHAQGPVNTSRHDGHRSYYDTSLRALVEARARPLLERFDYAF